MKHKLEMCRWASLDDGIGVWVRLKQGSDWTLTEYPSWRSENHYVVDDQHAEQRKQYIDEEIKNETSCSRNM